MNCPKSIDLAWYNNLQQAGKVADCNQWEIERFRVLPQNGSEQPVNWVEFDWESGVAVHHQFDPKRKENERRTLIDYDTAFEMMKDFNKWFNRKMQTGFIDPMYVRPTDYWFVHDWELVAS